MIGIDHGIAGRRATAASRSSNLSRPPVVSRCPAPAAAGLFLRLLTVASSGMVEVFHIRHGIIRSTAATRWPQDCQDHVGDPHGPGLHLPASLSDTRRRHPQSKA